MSVSQYREYARRTPQGGMLRAKEGLRFAINFLRTNAAIDLGTVLTRVLGAQSRWREGLVVHRLGLSLTQQGRLHFIQWRQVIPKSWDTCPILIQIALNRCFREKSHPKITPLAILG